LVLLQQPDQLARLRQTPQLAESAINEVLRYESPVQVTIRSVLAEVEFAGKRLRQGDHVAFLLGAANRDPAVFPDPDRLDITRCTANHLAFGQGTHYCLGAPLARLEAAIVLRTLLQRLPFMG
jgi:pimeloyl-[acyl-carrier protein] synthase